MITIDLSSSIVTNLILIALALLGFSRGFRYMVSIALFETIGYLLTVQNGDVIVNFVNRFYSNLPKLFAFTVGRDPSSVDALGPVIPDNFQAPLLLRVLVFVGLLVVGIGYAWPWEGQAMSGFDFATTKRTPRLLGALTGLYVAVLGISAISTFWGEAAASLNLPAEVATALNGLPNYINVVPSVITAFAIVLGIILLLRVPLLLQPPGGGGGPPKR